MAELSFLTAAGRRRSELVEWIVLDQGQSHNATVLADWSHLNLLNSDGCDKVVLDGCSLNIPAVIAVARYVFQRQNIEAQNSCTVTYTICLSGISDRKIVS